MKLNYNLIGEQISRIRRNKKITQAELAELTDLSVPYISHIETGRRKASLETIVRIANALEVTPDRLLTGNLKFNKIELVTEFNELLSDCSSKEKYVIYNAAAAIKKSLRNIHCSTN